jgi:hypothetical protein
VVWFSVVYLGEHYVVDVLAGIVLVAVTELVMARVVVPRVAALREPRPVTWPAGEVAPLEQTARR